MKVKVAIILLSAVFLELADAASKNPYRISRSNRKKKESYDYNFDYDSGNQAAHDLGGDEYGAEHVPVHHGSSSGGHGKTGFSEGSGSGAYFASFNSHDRLRSIAQGSADQANSAVANQELAAKQASYIAQNNLANLALQASATAMAALQGKQVLLAKIEQENLDAHQALENELQQLRQAKRSAKAAQQAASQALQHLQLLQTALNNAQTSSEHAQQAASEASAELASQTNMVGKAKARVEHLEESLHQARIDYEATLKAANDAQSSAQVAQNNAAEAAAKASLSSYHDTSSGHGASSYHESDGGHGGHLDAYGSQKSIAVASPNGGNQQAPSNSKNGGSSSKHGGSSGENKSSDSIARSTNVKQTSAEVIAANHNYGGNKNEFKPSAQYSYAGY